MSLESHGKHFLDAASDAIFLVGKDGRIRYASAHTELDESDAPVKEVRVSTSMVDDDIVVEIADTGPGMPEEVLAQAFAPFFSTRDEGDGTGLGLTIVQNTVQGLGGKVEVDSVIGKGTAVRVILPTQPHPGE